MAVASWWWAAAERMTKEDAFSDYEKERRGGAEDADRSARDRVERRATHEGTLTKEWGDWLLMYLFLKI